MAARARFLILPRRHRYNDLAPLDGEALDLGRCRLGRRFNTGPNLSNYLTQRAEMASLQRLKFQKILESRDRREPEARHQKARLSGFLPFHKLNTTYA